MNETLNLEIQEDFGASWNMHVAQLVILDCIARNDRHQSVLSKGLFQHTYSVLNATRDLGLGWHGRALELIETVVRFGAACLEHIGPFVAHFS
jgi:hypothetical protein